MSQAAECGILDGRLARSARARAAVAEAFLDIVNEGNLRPTAERVARRAGFSLRLVFHHFADLESLFAVAADRQTERLSRLVRPIRAELPLAERLPQFIAQRTRLLEAMSPVRRAALLHEPFSPVIARRLDEARKLTRRETERIFARELDTQTAPERRILLAALDAASAWPTWENLRRHQRLSVSAARAVRDTTLRALLEANSPRRRSRNNGGNSK
jgi:TetR/AcrR family transcriptional regulator, regulator of autoinduction and epiphytic fitness